MKKNKKEKSTETKLRFQLIVSLMCIILCAAALASSAYAWFTLSVSNDMPPVNASEYLLSITDDEDGTIDDFYTFPSAGLKVFTLTAANSENNSSTGYCRITINGTVYYTKQIKKGNSLMLKIRADAGTAVEFTPCWGTSAYYTTDDPVLYGGDTEINAGGSSGSGEAPVETEPPVPPAETEPSLPPVETEPPVPADPAKPADNGNPDDTGMLSPEH